MSAQHISDAEFAAALSAGEVEAASEIRARSVRYLPDRDLVEIVTARHAGFLIPRSWIGALQEVPPDELDRLAVWPDGSAIELESRDVHISVNGLLLDLLPAILPPGAVGNFAASPPARRAQSAGG